MDLKKSGTGTPYIDLIDSEGQEYGKLIFSKITATEAGYKYLCFTHRFTNQVVAKKGKGDKSTHTFTNVDVNDSYTFNMLMKRDGEGIKGVPQGMMPRRLVDWIIATIGAYTTDEGIFPYSEIEKLKWEIAEVDILDVLVTDGERVKAAKKAARLAKKAAKVEAADKANLEEKVMRDETLKEHYSNEIAAPVTNKETVNLMELF